MKWKQTEFRFFILLQKRRRWKYRVLVCRWWLWYHEENSIRNGWSHSVFIDLQVLIYREYILHIKGVYFTCGSVYLQNRKCNIYFPSFVACNLEILFSGISFSWVATCSLEILFSWVVFGSAWAGFLTWPPQTSVWIGEDVSRISWCRDVSCDKMTYYNFFSDKVVVELNVLRSWMKQRDVKGTNIITK